jgi:hypothetical protein
MTVEIDQDGSPRRDDMIFYENVVLVPSISIAEVVSMLPNGPLFEPPSRG